MPREDLSVVGVLRHCPWGRQNLSCVKRVEDYELAVMQKHRLEMLGNLSGSLLCVRSEIGPMGNPKFVMRQAVGGL